MPFEWIGGEEPPLEKRRRQRGKRRLHELHFKWRNAVEAGDTIAALTAALNFDQLAAEVYGDDWDADLETHLAHEPANNASVLSARTPAGHGGLQIETRLGPRLAYRPPGLLPGATHGANPSGMDIGTKNTLKRCIIT
jgi:hypothetical protein